MSRMSEVHQDFMEATSFRVIVKSSPVETHIELISDPHYCWNYAMRLIAKGLSFYVENQDGNVLLAA